MALISLISKDGAVKQIHHEKTKDLLASHQRIPSENQS